MALLPFFFFFFFFHLLLLQIQSWLACDLSTVEFLLNYQHTRRGSELKMICLMPLRISLATGVSIGWFKLPMGEEWRFTLVDAIFRGTIMPSLFILFGFYFFRFLLLETVLFVLWPLFFEKGSGMKKKDRMGGKGKRGWRLDR